MNLGSLIKLAVEVQGTAKVGYDRVNDEESKSIAGIFVLRSLLRLRPQEFT